MSAIRNKEKGERLLSELPIVGNPPVNEKEEKFLREICEYEFYNLEEQGMENRFLYGSTKKGTTFTFEHGKRYKVPRHVARHVESCATPRYGWRPSGEGPMIKTRLGDKVRFQMRPVFA